VIVKQSLLEGLRDMMSFTYFFFAVLLAFGFAMAFVVIYNTFTANIIERTREIATMRTIGEDNAHLAAMVTLENMLLACVGLPLGIWLGLRMAEGVLFAMSSEQFSLRIVVQPRTYVWVVLAAIAVLLLSEIPPIRRIFRLDLAEATKVME
jgi:putative ABC transport system permease protein